MQLFNALIRVIYERRRGMEIEEIYKIYINDVYRYLFSLSLASCSGGLDARDFLSCVSLSRRL